MLPKNSRNLFSGPMDEREMHLCDSILGFFLTLGPLLSLRQAFKPWCLLYPLLTKTLRIWAFSLSRFFSS